MIEDELHASSTLTWTLRLGGWLIMLIGLNFMTNIIYTLGELFNYLSIICVIIFLHKNATSRYVALFEETF